MSYTHLIPSMDEYADRFKQLGESDFKIIKGLVKYGFSNINKLAKDIGIPQQTVSYHCRKLDKQNLVRFRALIDETKLGLKSLVTLASCPLGKEDMSGRAMTCFPLWRYLAIVDGWKNGNFVRYSVPCDKEKDLHAFLNEIKKRNLITDYEIFPTTSPNYPLLNLDFYSKKKGIPVFNWDKWAKDLDTFPEDKIVETTEDEKAKFDLHDLIILRCLEINARISQRAIVKEMGRIFGEKKTAKYIPLVSRRIRDTIIRQDMIRGYRAYLFPNPVPTTLFTSYHLVFSNSASLRRFITGLSYLPYNTAYEKILHKDELFIRLALPAYEYSQMRSSFTTLAQSGHLKEANLLFGDLANRTWDNVEMYQMFKDGTWNFSYGTAIEMLDKTMQAKPTP